MPADQFYIMQISHKLMHCTGSILLSGLQTGQSLMLITCDRCSVQKDLA